MERTGKAARLIVIFVCFLMRFPELLFSHQNSAKVLPEKIMAATRNISMNIEN